MTNRQEIPLGTRSVRSDALVHRLVADWATQTPDAVAVRSGDRHVTYGCLNAAANRLARVLRGRGVRPASLVAVALEPSPELVVALLATLKAGGGYVPLDPGDPRERLTMVLADAAPACIVTTRVTAHELGLDHTMAVFVEDDLTGEVDDTNFELDIPGSSIAYLMYTSGSTGAPKAVVVDHASIIALVKLDERIAVAPGEVVVQLASVAFDATTFELWAPLCSGGTVAVISARRKSIADLGAQLRTLRPDWLFLTSGLFHLLVDHDIDAFTAVGRVLTGGDVLSPHRIVEAARSTRVALYAAYGPTETTTFASVHRVAPNTAYERVPLGTPLNGMRMIVLDDELSEVKQGKYGEIFIGGMGVARAYHRRPDLTAERFVPDPFAPTPGQRLYRTGDLGRRLESGEIEFLGRVDRQVKIRGFRVELGEVEAALARCPDVAASAVIAIDSDAGMKRLVAYAAPRNDAVLTESDMRSWLEAILPAYMLPSEYVILDQLPLDRNGKVHRASLPYPWRQRESPPPAKEKPRTEVESLLATVWTEVLEVDELGIHDDFFDNGGNSLLSVDVIADLRARGLVVNAHDLFANPTIAGLAPLVRITRNADVDMETPT